MFIGESNNFLGTVMTMSLAKYPQNRLKYPYESTFFICLMPRDLLESFSVTFTTF